MRKEAALPPETFKTITIKKVEFEEEEKGYRYLFNERVYFDSFDLLMFLAKQEAPNMADVLRQASELKFGESLELTRDENNNYC